MTDLSAKATTECLTCRYWRRNKDKLIGTCLQLNEYRFQHERENMFCTYVFGEDRIPSKDRYSYRQFEEELPFEDDTDFSWIKPMPYYKKKAIERRYE